MSTFFVVCYIISLSLAIFAFIVGIWVGTKRIHTVRILPRALRLYLLICGVPYFFLVSLCSMYVAIYYLQYNSINHYLVDLVRSIMTFANQQIRNTFFLILFERIIATIKLEKYKMSNSNILLWRLITTSYVISIVYFGYNVYAKTLPDIPLLFNLTTYYAYLMHIFMLSVCAILYLLNRRMYKLSAYKITLKRRYTIAQNVKSLAYLFPSVLIYGALAQSGSLISIIFQTLDLPSPPMGLTHIFFNLSFLLIYFRHYCIHSDEKTNLKTLTTVKNPLGKNIPMNVTTDQYFHDLQHILYLLICGVPYFFLVSLCSIYIAIYYLSYNSINHYSVDLARNIMMFSSQQIRNTFMFIMLERIIATVKLEKYKMSNSKILLWRLTTFSYILSALYFGYSVYAKRLVEIPLLFNLVNYYAYCAHIFMVSACAILYLKNRRMYKLSAYRITLKRRYTIAQNIKALKYFFPPILIYSMLAQFGSLITISFQALNLPTPPIAVYHIFFNLSFLLIFIRHYYYNNKTANNTNITTITNPLGKNIPMNVTTDQYFNDLQHQWI